MPGRREFGVLDIKADDLRDIAALQPRWTAPAQGRELWVAVGDGRAFSNASPGPETGPGAEVCLTAIASFSDSCFLPISSWAQGTGWVGSCPVLPHQATSGLDHSSSQGQSPGSSWPESASPLATQTGPWWGGSQSHSGKGSRGRFSLGSHKTSIPPSCTSRLPKEAQCNLGQAPASASCLLSTSLNPFLWPSLWPLVFFPDWRFPRGPLGE